MKDLGRPKEFSGKEKDSQEWSKKTEAFFAGVIKESEMMLEWSAEQAGAITTGLVDLEFLSTSTNQERGVQNLEFVLQQMHSFPARVMMQMTFSPTRGTTHWWHGEGSPSSLPSLVPQETMFDVLGKRHAVFPFLA